jgi:hypothetical protein
MLNLGGVNEYVEEKWPSAKRRKKGESRRRVWRAETAMPAGRISG